MFSKIILTYSKSHIAYSYMRYVKNVLIGLFPEKAVSGGYGPYSGIDCISETATLQ